MKDEMNLADEIEGCPLRLKNRIAASYVVDRQRANQYEVTPPGSPWIEGVDLDAIYPQQCYLRAYKYTVDVIRCLEKHQLVIGQTSLAFGGHAWVELPNGVVFDGVYQRFYDKKDYYGSIANATPWYFFNADATAMLGAHLRTSPGDWSLKLGLPMIMDGRPPIRINSEKAWARLVDYYRLCDESLLMVVPTNVLQRVAKDCGAEGTRRMKKTDLIQVIQISRSKNMVERRSK